MIVLLLPQPELAGPQAVAVGGEEYSAVAFAFDCGKKPLGFVLGEELSRTEGREAVTS